MHKLILTNNLDDSSITEFLSKDERARIYHHPAWLKSLCDAYGGKPLYVLIQENEDIQGLAPFILFQKGSSKKKIISLPFTNYSDFILPVDVNIKMIIDYVISQLGPIIGV